MILIAKFRNKGICKGMNFAEIIRRQGYRMTPQRQIVLDVIAEHGGHVNTHEIVTAVQAEMPVLNKATVYRTLDFLCELQLITRTEIGGQAVYELCSGETHHHLVCRVCGHVAELSDVHFKDLADHLLAEHNFVAELNHMAISGICSQCQPDE